LKPFNPLTLLYSWWVKKLTEKEFGKTKNMDLGLINTDDRKIVEKFAITFGLIILPKAENGKIIHNRMPFWDVENPAGGGEVKKVLKSVQSV
jgi:hypothetical protein